MRKLNDQKFCGWCGFGVEYKAEWMSECPNCGYKNYMNPNPCSNILVVKDKSVLMVKRAINPFKGKLDLPGGFMEIPDESMESASLRELHEEVGIGKDDVEEPAYLGSAKSPVYEWQDTEINNVSFFYVCRLKNSEQKIHLDTSENSEAVWVTRQDLPNIDFAWDIDKQMLTKFFEGER